jgi:hypothetical protein
MPTLQRSLEDTLAVMGAEGGKSWPNPWWPTGISAYDDCAAFVSWALFGLNGRQPFYTYVSQIQNWGRSLGTWHSRAAGLQRGDVIAFDWDGDGDPDHTEVCVSVSADGLRVTSRGTNANPGDDVRDRTRSTAYVLSYIRPAYPATASASTGAGTPIQEDDMFTDADRAMLADTHILAKAAYDAAFTTNPVQRPGRNATPGGILVNQSIERDALFQEKGVNGATRDGVLVALGKIQKKLGAE